MKNLCPPIILSSVLFLCVGCVDRESNSANTQSNKEGDSFTIIGSREKNVFVIALPEAWRGRILRLSPDDSILLTKIANGSSFEVKCREASSVSITNKTVEMPANEIIEVNDVGNTIKM